MKKILIIGTGGTIAGKGDAGRSSNYRAGSLSAEDIFSAVYGIEKVADFDFMQVSNVDSCNMTYDIVYNIACAIEDNENKYDGFVVTHGTDTMEETAFLLNMVLNTEKPVVMTGSMKPSTALSPDGPANLYESAVVAASGKTIGMGVLICFGGGIMSARNASKISTFRTNAFNQKDLGLLGWICDDRIEIINTSLKPHTTETAFSKEDIKNMPSTPVIYFSENADTELLELVVKKYKGIVIAGAGNGGYSDRWVNVLSQTNIPIVRCSKIANGIISHDDRLDTKQNIILSSLSPEKSRLLLQLTLSKSDDTDFIKNVFEKY